MKLHTQEQKQHKAPRLFLKKTRGQKIDIKNTPFSVEEEKIMDCQFGHHYLLKQQGKNKLRLQDTMQESWVSGQNQNQVLHTLPGIFITKAEPEFTATKTASRRGILEQLRQDLASGKAVQVERKPYLLKRHTVDTLQVIPVDSDYER